MNAKQMRDAVALAVDGVRMFYRWNDWTRDHVQGHPIEFCRWSKGDDTACEVLARHPGLRESDGAMHLAKHVREARADAAIAAIWPIAMERAAQVVIDWPVNIGQEEEAIAAAIRTLTMENDRG